MTTTAKHQILIVGGGTAGITVAARMLRKGYTDVAVIEPSNTHYYQPLWTLVGGGQAKASTTAAHRILGDAHAGHLDQEVRVGLRPGQQHGHLRRRGDLRLRRAGGLPGHPARLEPHRGTRGRPRPRRGVVELPVRPRPTHLGLHPQHAIGHRGVHHAVRADQVRRRAAEDRLPGQPITGESRACSTTSTSTSSCRHRGCSASRRSPTTSMRSSPTTASPCTPTPR